jgi:RNA polymerase sigma-70 factor, ECF subfamily
MQAAAADLEAHRAALTGHCYRMLGSAAEADDAVQDTMVRAWRSLDRFDGRASLRTWLYRIATNVCLDAVAARARRHRPLEDGPQGTPDDELVTRPSQHWLEPVADAKAIPADEDPARTAMLRQSVRLAFVAALQHLPAKPRAALLLADVLGYSADEIAEMLETSVAAINSALQRARATLASRPIEARGPSPQQGELVERFADAFLRYDLDALTALLHHDAVLSMPPFSLWLRGAPTIRRWLGGRGAGCRGSRLLRTSACGAPAFAQYRLAEHAPQLPGVVRDSAPYQAFALITLELVDDRIAAMTSFLDTAALFPHFGMPPSLGARDAA